MEQCPACGATNKGNQACQRCKMDFGPLIAVEDNALMHVRESRNAFERQDCLSMLFHARRAFSLKKTKAAARLLAVAALLNEDYSLAMAVWQYERRLGCGGSHNLDNVLRSGAQLKRSYI